MNEHDALRETALACRNCDRFLMLNNEVHFAPVGLQHVAICVCGVRAGLMRKMAGAWEIVWIQFPEPVTARVIEPKSRGAVP